MGLKAVTVEIRGISPLLMHKYPLMPVEALEKRPPDEQAELAAYRDETTGNLYIPGVNVQRALVAAAAFSKGKGRASLQKMAAACVLVDPAIIDLGTKTFALDARPVVIPATKGRIVRFRPRLDAWACKFTVTFDDVLLKETEVRRIVDDCGLRVGLLDFRPERKGPFGRFMVVRWTPTDPK
jgi:hypothetical protein